MELDLPTADDLDSSCSTPYVSAPSSPGRPSNATSLPSSPPHTAPAPVFNGGGYFFSAPASPMHFIISNSVNGASSACNGPNGGLSGDIEFEFSSRYLSSMISADEIFCNGQIRPISNLDTPPLSPIPDDEGEMLVRGRGDVKLRSGSIHRRARSMSPMRNNRYQWGTDEEEEEEEEEDEEQEIKSRPKDLDLDQDGKEMADADETIPSVSASSSRSSSSSSSRSSKRWIFLKDLLYRSKSEGRERERGGPIRERFWTHMPFSKERSEKEKEKVKDREKPRSDNEGGSNNTNAAPATNKATNAGTRKRQSAHERLYNMNRAHAEEMRRRTFLPYRQGLLGCLGFSSKSYGAFNGFTKTLNPVFSSGRGMFL